MHRPLPLREASHAVDISNTQVVDSRTKRSFPLQTSPYDQAILDDFFDEMDGTDAMAPSPKRVRSEEHAPALPQKSALRASRLLDNHGLKLGGSIETMETGQATPLDMYLSSEEDASSEADDFSDYDYDSSNEDVTSPTRRGSQEDTARVVSVVYSGKPLIVDLTLRRRSMSPSSASIGKRSSTLSSKSPIDRPPSSASSTSLSPSRASRKSSLLSDIMSKKRPPFLNIDPYANGSTYSLELPKDTETQTEKSPLKQPRTPTQILKGVSRTFSLVRKRSRPFLGSLSPQPEVVPRDPFVVPTRHSFTMGGASSQENLALGSSFPLSTSISDQPTTTEQPKTPQTPVTFNDIVRAAKKNAMLSPPQVTQQPASPLSPAKGGKRGILSGLAARRRSIKLTGKTLGI